MHLTAGAIVRVHEECIDTWRRRRPQDVEPGDDIESLLAAQHFCNLALWDLEDEARSQSGDAHVAAAKSAIDARNQRRCDLIERIDEQLLALLPPLPEAPAEQHSETAGMMIDRLSILALKIRNMRAHAGRSDDAGLAAECAWKLEVLSEQRRDLAACFDRLMADCRAGRRFFKVYRQFKAYNDPRLSPSLSSKAPHGKRS